MSPRHVALQAALLLVCHHAHELAVLRAFTLELHVTVLLREQRVIAADADVGARVETRAALANDDVAREDRLAAVNLDA